MGRKKQRERMAFTKSGVELIVKAAKHCYTDGNCSKCDAQDTMMCIKSISCSGYMMVALTIMDVANPVELENVLLTVSPIEKLSTDRGIKVEVGIHEDDDYCPECECEFNEAVSRDRK